MVSVHQQTPLFFYLEKNLPNRIAYFEMGLEREISDDEEDEESSPENSERAKQNAEVEDYFVYVTEEEEMADEL
jgi:hypothetical protein